MPPSWQLPCAQNPAALATQLVAVQAQPAAPQAPAGYTQAPVSSQAVAPQVGSDVEQAWLQQAPPRQAALLQASSAVLVLVAAQAAPAPP